MKPTVVMPKPYCTKASTSRGLGSKKEKRQDSSNFAISTPFLSFKSSRRDSSYSGSHYQEIEYLSFIRVNLQRFNKAAYQGSNKSNKTGIKLQKWYFICKKY